MLSCCCSLAGTRACFNCPAYQRVYGGPTIAPFIDYERLAEEIAKKLRPSATNVSIYCTGDADLGKEVADALKGAGAI